MTARDLLTELQRRGVKLQAKEGQLIALAPTGTVTPDLAAQIKAQKEELLKELRGGEGAHLAPLPEPLARLIQAAAGNHLNRLAVLPSGIVPNLGDYVLTCAALYACGVDPDRQLHDLWTARGAWAT